MKLNEDELYIKITELNEIYNFVVNKFFYLKLFIASKTHFTFSYFLFKIYFLKTSHVDVVYAKIM
jgi:hypothetical protein